MPELVDTVVPGFAFQSGERVEQPRASSISEFPEDLVNLSIPSKGIVMAFVASGALWAGIIFGARALWLLLR